MIVSRVSGPPSLHEGVHSQNCGQHTLGTSSHPTPLPPPSPPPSPFSQLPHCQLDLSSPHFTMHACCCTRPSKSRHLTPLSHPSALSEYVQPFVASHPCLTLLFNLSDQSVFSYPCVTRPAGSPTSPRRGVDRSALVSSPSGPLPQATSGAAGSSVTSPPHPAPPPPAPHR